MATSRYAQLRYVTLYHITGIAALFIASGVLAVGTFDAGDAGTNPSQSRMSQDKLIALALSAAPAILQRKRRSSFREKIGSAVMKLKIASLGSDDNNVEEAVCAQ